MGQIDLTTKAEDEGPEIVYVNEDGTVDGQDDLDDAPAPEVRGRGRVTEDPPKRVWPPELIKEAKKYIDREYIDAGGDWRENQFGTRYWLDLDHLVEFEKADQRISDDKEFWAWFRDYLKEHGIMSKPKDSWGSHRKSYLGDYEYHSKDKNYLTSWWSGWGYSGSTELTNRLAIALGAVQSIVSVINDTLKPYRVRLASEDTRDAPKSYTSFDDQLVVVSPQALLDNGIKQEDGIEVTSGWGLHEASHVQYTEKVWDVLRTPTVLRPLVVASTLLNLLEDVRIEALTSQKYPGFAGYFAKANSYLWDITKDFAPKAWGPELGDKINAITAITKWGTEYAEVVAASNDQALKDEYAWFTAWRDRYQTSSKTARQSLIEALDHLNEDPKTKQQMQDQAGKEKQQEGGWGNPTTLTDEQFRELIKALKSAIKDKNGRDLFEPCPSPGMSGRKIRLTEKQAQEISQLVQEGLESTRPQIGPSTEGTSILSKRPIETSHSISLYRKPGPLVAKLKSAFVFRKIAPDWLERAQRQGQLDENDLWKIVGQDLRVFERKITVDMPNTQITLLVDMSSSMHGENVRKAQELATVMLESLRTMKGVTVRVRGHNSTGGAAAKGTATMVYRIWDPGDPMTRLGLIRMLCAGSTPDGFALDWCSQELLASRKPGEDMVLIILSDGQPNVTYNGMTGPDHVFQVVEANRRKGITTISIALGAGLSATAQRRMYRNVIPYENDQKLPMQMTRLLIKLFGGATQ